MSIKIICKKVPKVLNNTSYQLGLITKFYDYNYELTNCVHIKGYIKSESYYNSDINEYKNNNIDSILTLSEWNSHFDWNNWFHSIERLNINKKYNHIIEKENIYILKRDNVFLL